MSDALLMVGRVAGAFGVKGELRITSFTADPMSLVDYKTLLREDGSTALTLTGGRVAKGGVVVRAKEIETREQAEAARGLRLYIPRDLLEIEPAQGPSWWLPFTREAVPEVSISERRVVAVKPEETE
jgi:16S rRNA processing protein RimM